MGASVGLNTKFALRLQAYAKTINIAVQFQTRIRRHAENMFVINEYFFVKKKCL
jgi:hypothetical protein